MGVITLTVRVQEQKAGTDDALIGLAVGSINTNGLHPEEEATVVGMRAEALLALAREVLAEGMAKIQEAENAEAAAEEARREEAEKADTAANQELQA